MKLITTIFISLLVTTSVNAAVDESSPAVNTGAFSWSGSYVGANIGYAWGKSKFTDKDNWNSKNEQFSFKPDGFIGGIQGGYNWQVQNFVYGVEADIGSLNLRGATSQPSSFDTVASVKGKMYGSISARLGYAMDHTLFYVKTGGIYSNGKLIIDDSCNKAPCGPGLLYGSKKIGTGYQVGVGIEHMLNKHWTVKSEYSYSDFGNQTINSVNLYNNPLKYKANLSNQTIKIGLNYKF